MIRNPTPENRRVWTRINNGACPMEGCNGDWTTGPHFYARCTVDPKHFFKKSDLMAGKAIPIEPPSEEA